LTKLLISSFNNFSFQIATVLDGLSQQLFYDYRSDVKIEPVFKKGIVDMSTLKPNQIVSGVVMNITDFGAFIDLGVGKNGLVHSSGMRNASLKVSDRIECKVLQVDVAKGRIGLEFQKVLV
jgi:transcriptional accessory protein Tex/SPT6